MNNFSILFENEEILLINKPFGTAVQGGAGVAHPLDEELAKQLGYKIYLVHRLDKDTSGILVVAKNPVAAAKWTKLISEKEVTKEYMAICVGTPVVKGKEVEKGVVDGVLEAHGREQSAKTYFDVTGKCVLEIEKQTDTGSEIKKVGLSLIHITLGTGRMHQIRIQMAKIGAPLAADDQHGDFKANKLIRKVGIKKLCLAATRITIPVEGQSKVFEIPLPSHMQDVVDSYFKAEK